MQDGESALADEVGDGKSPPASTHIMLFRSYTIVSDTLNIGIVLLSVARAFGLGLVPGLHSQHKISLASEQLVTLTPQLHESLNLRHHTLP